MVLIAQIEKAHSITHSIYVALAFLPMLAPVDRSKDRAPGQLFAANTVSFLFTKINIIACQSNNANCPIN